MGRGAGMKAVLRLFGALLTVAIMTTTGYGQVPQQISFQGYLTDDLGNPVSDNDYGMVFSIYAAAEGGSAMWWEEQTVALTNGVFNVQIGQDPAGNPFPQDLFDAQRWLGVTVGADAEMSPRQPLTSVPFAIQAGGTFAGAVTDIMLADDAVTETKVAAGAITADKIAGGTGSGVDADLLDGMDAASFAPSVHTHEDQYYSKAHVNALEERIEALEAKLQYLTVVAETVNGMPGPHVMITGANFHVRSGSGITNGTVLGLGNLIVGYNELRETGNVRTGSHNIVVGREHNYSSYGGVAAGIHHTISAGYSSVSGGGYNTASGLWASVSGGANNYAYGDYSSVSGGRSNQSHGDYSSVSGGRENQALADGDYASVSGGYTNNASGDYASVSGGYSNNASGSFASVSGGYGNSAGNGYASVSGGYNNAASGSASSVSGGSNNTASNYYSSVSGGDGNEATNNFSSVSGGKDNTASGLYSSVSGGASRSAPGDSDWRAGSLFEDN
jgi:hypothetical protein